MPKSIKKTICGKLAGCPAFSCDDENCLAKQIQTHRPPPPTDSVAERHNHRWYYGSRWRTIRLGQLSREPLCQRCLTFDIVTAAVHVDHVTPHKGDASLFFDTSNLQSLCITDHSWKTIEERKGTDPKELDFRSFSHK